MSVPSPQPPYHRSFLVTSIGAYADSGLGTGGLTCIHEGQAVIVDKVDSTGLFAAGEMIFRFARGLQALVGYRPEGLRYRLHLPEMRDIHDLVLLPDGTFVCVSTGTNEVLWLDAFGNVTRRWKGAGEEDAWHLNCLCERDGRLYIAAFGRFDSHRGWIGKCTGTGMIMDLESGEDVIGDLSGPHNPRWIDGSWVICNSHAKNLIIDSPETGRRAVDLGGFTRGLAFDAHYYYVGESANRKAERPAEVSAIAVVSRATLEVVDRITVPFPEIYELILIPPEQAARIAANPAPFRVTESTDHTAALEKQVELSLQEIEVLKARVEKWKRRKGVSQALSDAKNSLLGALKRR